MSDFHINIFYSEDDAGYIADIPGPRLLLGVREHP
jgi:hypothetical protein